MYKTIENKAFLIPWTEEEKDAFFDEEYSYLYGAYENENLIAMIQLFTTKSMEEEALVEVNKKNICEIGGALVLPNYRNKEIMCLLMKKILELAKELKYEYALATVHPHNIASQKLVSHFNFQLCTTKITSSGYLRDFYIKEIK